MASGGVHASKGAYRRTRLTLRKLANKATVRAGQAVAYRLVVRNVGSTAAVHLRLCDAVPGQTTIVSRGGGRLTAGRICFTLASLAARRTRTFRIVLRADSTARGSIVNRARLSGTNFATVHAHATTRVLGGVRAHRESGVTG